MVRWSATTAHPPLYKQPLPRCAAARRHPKTTHHAPATLGCGDQLLHRLLSPCSHIVGPLPTQPVQRTLNSHRNRRSASAYREAITPKVWLTTRERRIPHSLRDVVSVSEQLPTGC